MSTTPPPVATPAEAYVALGANVGQRLANLKASCLGLQGGGVNIVARSDVFETDAVVQSGQPQQTPYLNAVLRVHTLLTPAALLLLAMQVEQSLGRTRSRATRWAPRTADIDLLLYDDVIQDAEGLTLPHPRLLQRAFVRVPLAQAARPGLRHPLTGERLDTVPSFIGVRPWGQGL